MKGYTLLYYTFQHEPSPDYNICKIKSEDLTSPSPQLKMKQILKAFPFDALSGLYHFRFKSQFKQNGQNVIGWIDITNVNSKVPIFNGSVYVKILKLKDAKDNKILTGDKLLRIREGTPEKKLVHHSSSVSPPPMNKGIPGKNVHSSTNLLDGGAVSSPSPIRKENPSANVNSSQSNNIFLLQPNQGNSSNQNGGDVQSAQKPKQEEKKPESGKKFVQSTQEKIDQARQNWVNTDLKHEGERLAAIEFDQRVQKWGYTMKTRNNFRTLLVTVHEIWPFGKWQQVDLGKLLTDNELKKYYKKAMLVFHPDQNQNTTHRQVYLAKRIFSQLNAAFNEEIK